MSPILSETLVRKTISTGERDEDIHPWACLKLLMEDARIALTHTDASNSMERQWADVKITSGVVFGTMFCAWFGLILIKAHCLQLPTSRTVLVFRTSFSNSH